MTGGNGVAATSGGPALVGGSSDGFDAFISYAREPSTALASQLQTSMERFAKPWNKLRAMRVFRDDQSMAANTALWSTIERGLRESSHLILLVTPQAAASPYVNKEVEWWVTHKGSQTILLVHQRGPLAWDRSTNDFTGDSAVPTALRGAYPEEPRWTNLSSFTDAELADGDKLTDAVADLSSAVRGIDRDRLVGENVAQHRKTMRMARGAIIGLSLLLVAALGAGVLAFVRGNEAQRQANLSLAQRLAVEGTAALDGNSLREAVQKITVASVLEPAATQRTRTDLMEQDLFGVARILQGDRASGLETSGVGTGRVFSSGNTLLSTVGGVAVVTDADTLKVNRHPDAVGVAVGADGSRIALWRPSTQMLEVLHLDGQRVGAPVGPFTAAPKAAFSSSGKTLFNLGLSESRRRVQAWDVQSGTLRWQDTNPTIVGAATLADDKLLVMHQASTSPDARTREMVFAVYGDGPQTRRDVTRGVDSWTGPRGQAVIRAVDGSYALWDLLAARRIAPIKPPTGSASFSEFAFSGDGGSMLATGGFGAIVFTIPDDQGRQPSAKLIVNDPASIPMFDQNNAALSHDGQQAIVTTRDGVLMVPTNGWDPQTLPAPGGVRNVSFSRGGRALLSTEGGVLLFEIAKTPVAPEMIADRAGLGVSNDYGSVDVYRYENGVAVPWFRKEGTPAYETIRAFSPKRMQIVMTGRADSAGRLKISVVTLRGDAPARTLTLLDPPACSSRSPITYWSSDSGRYLAAANCGNRVTVWDLDSGQRLREFQPSTGEVVTGAFDESGRDAKLIVVTGAMRSVVNIATGKTEVEDTFDDPISNAFLAGGRIALYTPSDSRIRVYGNAAAPRLGRALFVTGLDRVGGIALSGDGSTVAAGYVGLGGAANRLYAWSVGSGEELLAAAVADGSGANPEFVDDGRGVTLKASGARVYRLKTSVEDVCRLLDANMSRQTWDRTVGKAYKYVKACPGLPIEGE
jgi:WD40 repeat protein